MSTVKTDSTVSEAFVAIVVFVNDLQEAIGGPAAALPLSMYWRLLAHIKPNDMNSIRKATDGFATFMTQYGQIIIQAKYDELPLGAKIYYGTSERVYLDIQKYLHKADPDIRASIRSHLLTIGAILTPKQDMLEELSKAAAVPKEEPGFSLEDVTNLKIDQSTAEGKFISGLLDKARDSADSIDPSDNPMATIAKLATSGLLTDMMKGLNEGTQNGTLDIRRLLGTMHGAIGQLLPKDEPDGRTFPPSQAPIPTPSSELISSTAPSTSSRPQSSAQKACEALGDL